jgi:hypothetical protein
MRRMPLLLLVVLAATPLRAAGDGEILLAPGTRYETPAYFRSGAEDGPVVVVIGGWIRKSVEWLAGDRATRSGPVK